MHGGFFILALAVPPSGNNHKEKGGKRIWIEKHSPSIRKYGYVFTYSGISFEWNFRWL
jgi:hypothetical protein